MRMHSADVASLLKLGCITLNEAREFLGLPYEKPKPSRVRCEYCDSFVHASTNCPNCGAVLPAQAEVLYVADGQEFTLIVDEVSPFIQFARAAHDYGSVMKAPPLTQRR